MDRLRDILKATDAALFHSFETSWTIAATEWVATLKMEQESHGGLPHLESVEGRMDQLADAWRPSWSRNFSTPFGFNGLELYLALCAALFHDIGRGRLGDKGGDHGAESAKILKEHWARLGLVSGQVAFELADICAFHTSGDPWNRPDTVKVHPWGTVHTQAVAALLVLADELDTAYTRVVPSYMKDPSLLIDDRDAEKKIPTELVNRFGTEAFTKGVYREFISDVGLDPDSRVIKTVLFGDGLIGNAPPKPVQEKPGAAGWLWSINKQLQTWKEGIPAFLPEDYFFSFIDHCRLSDDSGLLDLLQEQFAKALDFNRRRLIRAFEPPTEEGRGGAFHASVLYDLDLAERMPTRLGRTSFSDVHPRLTALDTTINLIDNTIKNVAERLKSDSKVGQPSRSAELLVPAMNGLASLLVVMFYIACKLCLRRREAELRSEEKRLGETETQKKLEVVRKIHERWMSLDEVPESLNADEGGDRRLIEEHARLLELQERLASPDRLSVHFFFVLLFYYFAHIDLERLAKTLCRDAATLPKAPGSAWGKLVREWNSWSVRDFHRNIVGAFHVYLASVRRLWEIKDAVDYRYGGAGAIEARYMGQSQVACGNVPHAIVNVVWNQTVKEKGQAGSFPEKTQALRERFTKELLGHRAACGPAGGHHAIGVVDFRMAVRLIFMQWLCNDISTKNKALGRIRDGLAKLGIHFDAWMIEYNNHLFDSDWRLRIEPVLQRKDVQDVAERMFSLRSGLHRTTDWLPWDTLAAALREPHREKVTTAAIRFGSLLRIYSNLPDNARQALRETDSGWLHYGHVLLSDLHGCGNGTPGGEWTLETYHSEWRLSSKGSPARPWPDHLHDLVSSFLRRITEQG